MKKELFCYTFLKLEAVVHSVSKPKIKGVGHLGHGEAMEARGREFDPDRGIKVG